MKTKGLTISGGKILFFCFFLFTVSFFNNVMDKIERHFYGVKAGVSLESQVVENLLPDEVRLVVENLAIQKQRLPLEPAIDKKTGAIVPEEIGAIVDIERSIIEVLSAQENEEVFLFFIGVLPKYSSWELSECTDVLGAYESYIEGSKERYSNILLASKSINNTLLWPTEYFSFNEIVGPRTAKRGYKPAPVILSGEIELDYGGGVCQVSSTLYNAAQLSNMEIIERHGHSKPVEYVPIGHDATVSYGELDLIFKNVSASPVIINSGVSGGKFWVQLRGKI
ncbi:MAG TPA: VanW family protein [Syntrophomonadaceae bacterium]|nr:VanW family protein [Syntrophomonadaceae bacterium]